MLEVCLISLKRYDLRYSTVDMFNLVFVPLLTQI
jgi:hypothetical protein